MESLIVLIIFVLISSLNSGKKRRGRSNQNQPQNPAGQRMSNVRNLAQQARQMINDLQENDGNQRTTSRHTRQSQQKIRTHEEECGYCTGKIEVSSNLVHHVGAATVPKDTEKPLVDVSSLQKNMGLSDLQNVLLWQEILDKPLALRRRNLR